MSTLKLTRNSLPALAYVKQQGSSSPSAKRSCTGGIFCSGYMSSMFGAKATAIEEYFLKKGLSFIRFDYTDVGLSADTKFPAKYSFKQWKDDVSTVIDQLTEGPQVLIGSSMGGWMSLLNCLDKPDRIAGLMLIAPSLDFSERIIRRLPKETIEKFEKGETCFIDGPYGKYPIHKNFATESKSFELLNQATIDVSCPVRILHSINDDSAPYDVSLQLMKKLVSTDIELHLMKSSDHRMSSDADIEMLKIQLDSLFKSLEKSS